MRKIEFPTARINPHTNKKRSNIRYDISNEPYTVFIIDNISKDTVYWINEFLNLHPKSDNINNTNQFLQLTQSYIKHEYPQYCDSKADQVDLINRSIQYFKDQDTFDFNDFTHEVIGRPQVIDSFNQYKENYKHKLNLNIDDQFTIADALVKKLARAFKDVIN